MFKWWSWPSMDGWMDGLMSDCGKEEECEESGWSPHEVPSIRLQSCWEYFRVPSSPTLYLLTASFGPLRQFVDRRLFSSHTVVVVVSWSVICKNAGRFCFGWCSHKYNMPKSYYEAGQQKQNMINYHYKSTCTRLQAMHLFVPGAAAATKLPAPEEGICKVL